MFEVGLAFDCSNRWCSVLVGLISGFSHHVLGQHPSIQYVPSQPALNAEAAQDEHRHIKQAPEKRHPSAHLEISSIVDGP